MIVLQGSKLTQYFNGKVIFQDIDIEVKKGEIVSLIGTSGVDKTTLLNVLAGLSTPNYGDVYLNNKNITGESGNVGYMLQKDLLLPFKNTIDNVCLPLKLKHLKKETQYNIAKPYLSLFGLKDSEEKYPNNLSGGMRQRAAFLRTFLYNNEIMLLDEPFSALDTLTKSDIHTWFKEVVKQIETSVLFITHDIDEAIYLSHKIYVMNAKKQLQSIDIMGNSNEEFLVSNEFLEYKKQIISLLIK